MKTLIFISLAFCLFFNAQAQQNKDSLNAEATLEELFTICNSVLSEEENSNVAVFERLAPYVLYAGNDMARNSKVACEYNKAEDKKLVDYIGHNLKIWLDKISEFKVVKFQNTKKDGSDWYYLTVSYKPANGTKNKVFAFIKVNDKFLLGKIE